MAKSTIPQNKPPSATQLPANDPSPDTAPIPTPDPAPSMTIIPA